MFNVHALLGVLKNVNKQKFKVIFGLMIIFTIILCFCHDDEFGGLLLLTEKLEQIHKTKPGDKVKELEREIKVGFEKVFERFYYVVVTSTTVGFGDVIAKSIRVRIFTVIYLILLFAISLS